MSRMQAAAVPPAPTFAGTAERYVTPLPELTDEVSALSARVEGHLAKMGASWK